MKKSLTPILLSLTAGLLFSASAAQARRVVVTDANNEKTVTLHQGDTLVVRLPFNTFTDYSWHVVYDPDGPLRVSAPGYTTWMDNRSGMGGTEELRFSVPRSASFGRGGWLRLISLRPFASGVKDGKLWEIKYTIAAAK